MLLRCKNLPLSTSMVVRILNDLKRRGLLVPCALIKRSAISPRSNSSSAGNLNKRMPSATDHVNEYTYLHEAVIIPIIDSASASHPERGKFDESCNRKKKINIAEGLAESF